MTEEPLELALKCFDGDYEKAEALLKLLALSSEVRVSMPNLSMVIPEDSSVT